MGKSLVCEVTYIYALVDPVSRCVRYVGKANDPLARHKEHVARINCRRHQTDLVHWIKAMLTSGILPGMVVLACVPKHSWQRHERHWIGQFRHKEGASLLNYSGGGNGID